MTSYGRNNTTQPTMIYKTRTSLHFTIPFLCSNVMCQIGGYLGECAGECACMGEVCEIVIKRI